jgi:YidC/Oxa1 family membrane protein insertase
VDRNFILAMVLSMAVFSAWLAWEQHQRPVLEVAPEAVVAAEAESAAEPNPKSGAVGVHADTAAVETVRSEIGAGQARAAATDTHDVALWRGTLENEVAVAQLDNRGGTLSGWRIKGYYETPARERNVELIAPSGEGLRALQTPFLELGIGDLSDAPYEVETLGDRAVRFVLRRSGITIRKTYEQGVEAGYGLSLTVEIENASDHAIAPTFTMAWPAERNQLRDFSELALIAISEGSAERAPLVGIGQPGFMSRIMGRGEAKEAEPWRGVEWAGIDLRYFAAVVGPLDGGDAQALFVPIENGRRGAVVVSQAATEIKPGNTVTRRYTTFLGPKEPPLLEELGGTLPVLISSGYSWVAPLTRFFGWALHTLHDFVPNYGLAIILITILVRLATWPIMARQMKSAERMRELMPRIKELQEKFKDDRQRQSEETFKLYRETGVNPLGGCLPMVLQLPVFIGLFYALQSSIDLRHAHFMLWINDLSAPATLFTLPGVDLPVRLLPLLMGASMYGQQKMMPQAGVDPAQARMMLIMMPGMMLVISYGFPAGLVLYWLVSNLLGIGHQLLVRRQMHAAK